MNHPSLAALRGWKNSLTQIISLGATVCVLTSSLAIATTTMNLEPIGGGGYITGLTPHPLSTSSLLLYGRTDVGGCYRYNPSTQTWTQLMNSFSSHTYFSLDGMAVDPEDSGLGKVYAFCGDGVAAHVMYSSNQGSAWTDTGLSSAVEGYGNAEYRWAGERMAIDPNYSGRMLLGTRAAGLWYNNTVNTSTTSSSTWAQTSTSKVPTGYVTVSGDNIGLTFVAFDKGSGTVSSGVNEGFTKVVYAGVYGGGSTSSAYGVYRSTDGGSTWATLTGTNNPKYPVHGQVDSNGNLWVTTGNSGSGDVLKFPSGRTAAASAAWTVAMSSTTYEFSGLSIDSSNDIVVASGNVGAGSSKAEIFYSANDGSTWSANRATGTVTNTIPWESVATYFFASHMSYVVFDPSVSHGVWMGDWYNAWNNSNISSSSPAWTNPMSGWEEGYIITLVPQSPGTLNSALYFGQNGGNGFWLPTTQANQYPAATNVFSTTGFWTGFASSESDDTVVYAVGDDSGGFGYKGTASGTGVAWGSSFAGNSGLPSTAAGGRIAVSATNTNLVDWLPMVTNSSGNTTVPYYSTNGGTAWAACSGVTAADYMTNDFYPSNPLASNKTTTNCFYVYKPDVGFFSSTDGETYHSTGNLTSISGYGAYGVKAVPSQNGGVWVYVAGSTSGCGAYHSTNFGQTFTQVSAFKSVTQMGFGAPAPGSGQPAAVYVFGQQSGDSQDWLYQSDDMGYSWSLRLNSASNALGNDVSVVEGDRSTFGTVYIGFHGSGTQIGTSNILFDDDFQTGQSTSFDVYSGSWQMVQDGSLWEYQETTDGSGLGGSAYISPTVVPASTAWSNYTVTADMTPVTFGTGTDGQQSMTLSAYVQDASGNYSSNRYYVSLYKMPQSETGGTYNVLIKKNQTGQSAATLGWGNITAGFVAGTTYTVALSASNVPNGSNYNVNLAVYVNGTQVATATDTYSSAKPTFTDGTASLSTWETIGNFTGILVTTP